MNRAASHLLSSQLTLANCADEAIHLPGQIQPHGTLLAFDQRGLLVAWAANAASMLRLPLAPSLGLAYQQLAPSAEVAQLVADCLQDMEDGEADPRMIETSDGRRHFDCIAHVYQGRVLVEFERQDQRNVALSQRVLLGQRALDRLKRKKTVAALLQFAVEQVRAMTGFDRVMAYRFRPDDSGEVVAEARLATLTPYLGQRYPASDIPAQARRLYIINTLRLIADVGYQPVPVFGAAAGLLDMSHGVLRSVSPVHIEYLQNMGVAASMSVSILVNGRLWGMLACHHMSANHVPYAIRTACDVLAQVLALTARALEARAEAALLERSVALCAQLGQALLLEEDLAAVLPAQALALLDLFGAQALVLAQHGKLQCHGDIAPALAAAIVASLPQQREQILQRGAASEWPQPPRADLGKWVGLLGLSFNPAGGGWLLLLRSEQIEAVRWGGKPQKILKTGPLGARLTPRGSFEEWRETVRDRCEPWEPANLDAAQLLLATLHRATLFRRVETDRVRGLLLAMLSHDLRDPLHAIQMAATLLQQDERQRTLGRRILSSGRRMQRLICQVTDMSQRYRGAAMALSIQTFDLAALVADLVEESRIGHPNVEHLLELPASCPVDADADRIAQVITNLLGNALHHGASLRPIRLAVLSGSAGVTLSVRNESAPIRAAVVEHLFAAFKDDGHDNASNPGGMGLGLFIVQEVMAAHQGSVHYRYEAPYVIFSAHLPRRTAPARPAVAPVG